MTSTSPTTVSPSRLLAIAGVAAPLVIAIALGVVAVNQASIVLPVSLSLPIGSPGVFASVDLAAASSLVLLVSVVGRAAALLLQSRGASPSRLRAVRALELSQVAGITVFLVAQLNGIAVEVRAAS